MQLHHHRGVGPVKQMKVLPTMLADGMLDLAASSAQTKTPAHLQPAIPSKADNLQQGLTSGRNQSSSTMLFLTAQRTAQHGQDWLLMRSRPLRINSWSTVHQRKESIWRSVPLQTPITPSPAEQQTLSAETVSRGNDPRRPMTRFPLPWVE